MGDQFRKVQPGDPLKIPAEAWNALVDLSRLQKNQRHDQLAEAEGTSRQTTLAKVRNQTGIDLERFSIVALGTPIITPAANLVEFKRQISFQGIVPSATTGPRFGVLLEPLKNTSLAPRQSVDVSSHAFPLARLPTHAQRQWPDKTAISAAFRTVQHQSYGSNRPVQCAGQ